MGKGETNGAIELSRLRGAKDTQFVLTQDRLPWLGLQEVETPSTSCESCQALSALFPISGVRAANTAKKENHSDYSSDYKRQKSEFQIYIATNVATTASEAQKFWISWLVQNENRKMKINKFF